MFARLPFEDRQRRRTDGAEAKTPWRDGTTHLMMSPLELMKLPIQWLLCGSQIRRCYVSRRSGPGVEPQAPKGCCTSLTGHSKAEVGGAEPAKSRRTSRVAEGGHTFAISTVAQRLPPTICKRLDDWMPIDGGLL